MTIRAGIYFTLQIRRGFHEKDPYSHSIALACRSASNHCIPKRLFFPWIFLGPDRMGRIRILSETGAGRELVVLHLPLFRESDLVCPVGDPDQIVGVAALASASGRISAVAQHRNRPVCTGFRCFRVG